MSNIGFVKAFLLPKGWANVPVANSVYVWHYVYTRDRENTNRHKE